MCEFGGGRADLWMGSKRWVDIGWVGWRWQWVGRRWVGRQWQWVGVWNVVGVVFFLFLFLFFCFGGCDSSGCGLIFMGCDGLMLMGGSSCGRNHFSGSVCCCCLLMMMR